MAARDRSRGSVQGFARLPHGVFGENQIAIIALRSVRWQRRPDGYRVYNFVVEDDHSYFVGRAGVGAWLHNAGPDCTKVALGILNKAGEGGVARIEARAAGGGRRLAIGEGPSGSEDPWFYLDVHIDANGNITDPIR